MGSIPSWILESVLSLLDMWMPSIQDPSRDPGQGHQGVTDSLGHGWEGLQLFRWQLALRVLGCYSSGPTFFSRIW